MATMHTKTVSQPSSKTPTWNYIAWDPSQEPSWNKSTWTQITWFTIGCTAVLLSLARAATTAAISNKWLEPLLAAVIGYVLADLFTGVFHWSVDNYGDANTFFFGNVIDSFQGHHVSPWSITEREVANNLHELGRATTVGVVFFQLLTNDASWLAFEGVFAGCVMFCQLFHSWAHTPKKGLHPLVVALQDMGLLISRKDHALHHQLPFDNNYCIVSGIWNSFLDTYRVFEGLEIVFFYLLGIPPRSWTDQQVKNVD